MRTKLFILLAVIVLAAGGAFILGKNRGQPPVMVTVRIAVTPEERLNFVAGEANSAKFKYLMGKQTGVKPVLAQKLSVKPVPNTKLLEAQVGVATREEGTRYAAAFADSLQFLCGTDTRITVAGQSVH